jgi:hypothetical protein
MSNTLILGIIGLLTMLLLPYGLLYGQSIGSGYEIYNNPNFGISIQHPSDWQKEERDDEFSQGVIFLVPNSPKKYMDKLSIGILDAEPNESLDSIVNDLIEFNKNQNKDYEVIESTTIKLNGIEGHKIVYTSTSDLFGNVKGMLIEILKGGKLYEILYTTEPERYDELLPIIIKMTNSFQIK